MYQMLQTLFGGVKKSKVLRSKGGGTSETYESVQRGRGYNNR